MGNIQNGARLLVAAESLDKVLEDVLHFPGAFLSIQAVLFKFACRPDSSFLWQQRHGMEKTWRERLFLSFRHRESTVILSCTIGFARHDGQRATGHAGLQSFTAQYFVREEKPQDEVACSIGDSV